VNGPNHAYFIQAPKGWVIDNGIWAEQKIFAVFYQAGKTLHESPIVAYSMVQEPSPAGIEEHIKADMVYSLKGSKTAILKRDKELKTQDGRRAIVFSLKGVPDQNPEWMAYIEAPTVVILVSVSVKNIKDFDQGQQLLVDLVSSIGWFTDKVTYNNKQP
jgi:hypothetical protein